MLAVGRIRRPLPPSEIRNGGGTLGFRPNFLDVNPTLVSQIGVFPTTANTSSSVSQSESTRCDPLGCLCWSMSSQGQR